MESYPIANLFIGYVKLIKRACQCVKSGKAIKQEINIENKIPAWIEREEEKEEEKILSLFLG